jgi:hypothetical protein
MPVPDFVCDGIVAGGGMSNAAEDVDTMIAGGASLGVEIKAEEPYLRPIRLLCLVPFLGSVQYFPLTSRVDRHQHMRVFV